MNKGQRGALTAQRCSADALAEDETCNVITSRSFDFVTNLKLLAATVTAPLSLFSGGVTHKRRCTYRPSVIYLIVNKLLSLSLSLSLRLSLPPSLPPSLVVNLKLPAATATASPPPVLSPTLLHVCRPCV